MRASFLAVLLLAGLAASGPAATGQIDRFGERAMVPPSAGLTPDPGCDLVKAAAGGSTAAPPANHAGTTQYIRCAGQTVVVRIETFSPRVVASKLLEAQRRLTEPLGTGEPMVSWLSLPGEEPRVWRVMEVDDTANLAVLSLWIDGKPAQIGLTTRLRQALRSITGATSTPVLVMVAPAGDWRNTTPEQRQQARQSVEVFFRHQNSLAAQLARLSENASGPKS